MAHAALKLIESSEEKPQIDENHSDGDLEAHGGIGSEVAWAVAGSMARPESPTPLHDLLSLIGDPADSLDDILDQAIAEGEKFTNWKESGKPLGWFRPFLRKGRELISITHYEKLFASRATEITVKLDALPDSNFEIWRCNEGKDPDFPLYRLRLSDVIAQNLEINEPLRDNIALNIRSEIMGDSVFITFSICTELQAQEIGEQIGVKESAKNTLPGSPNLKGFIEKLKSFINIDVPGRTAGVLNFGNGFAAALILFAIYYVGPAVFSAFPQGPGNGPKYHAAATSETAVTDVLVDRRLIDRCNRERCQG